MVKVTVKEPGHGQSYYVDSICGIGHVWSEFLQEYLGGIRVSVGVGGHGLSASVGSYLP